MREKYSVSCICPTYSRPRFLEQAVRLFLRQTWQRSELLIFDDSPKGLQAEIQESPRVKVFRLNERLPMGHKHNLGLAAAQGEFIAHFDDDDWQSPLRLIRQVETLAIEGLDLCGYVTDCLLTTGDARFWRFDRTFIPRKLYVGNSMISVGVPFMDGTAMFRRGIVGPTLYPTIQVSQKVQFLYDLWKKQGAKIKALPNTGMYVYTRHRKGSATNTWQYGRDRRLLPIEQPRWFPSADLDFYRRAA